VPRSLVESIFPNGQVTLFFPRPKVSNIYFYPSFCRFEVRCRQLGISPPQEHNWSDFLFSVWRMSFCTPTHRDPSMAHPSYAKTPPFFQVISRRSRFASSIRCFLFSHPEESYPMYPSDLKENTPRSVNSSSTLLFECCCPLFSPPPIEVLLLICSLRLKKSLPDFGPPGLFDMFHRIG